MKYCFLSLTLASALTLAACQNAPTVVVPPPVPPSTTPQPVAPAPHPPTPQAVTAGPLTQAGVGRYMDAFERDLRLRLRGGGIVAARRGDDMLLTLPDARLFAGEGLSPSGQNLLGAVAQVLRIYDHTLAQVNGYTDTAGTPERNLDVSRNHATAAGAVLTENGIAAARIEIHGFGGTNLKIMTRDHVFEPRNRRIEIRIVPRPG